MTKPIPSSQFAGATSASPIVARLCDGLPEVLDVVADAAPDTHRFLRRAWFAAALATYGGQARTLLVEEPSAPLLAIPMVPVGPRALKLRALPGCYWPFRGFPASAAAGQRAFEVAVNALSRELNALRIGPVYDGDPGAAPLIAAARQAGWTVLDRFIADSFVLDIAAQQAEGAWPRTSTLKKNRFHEKHLGAHGALDWRFVSGAEWNAKAFDDLARIEESSWLTEETDGRDAKFTHGGHGTFWAAAAADPVIAEMMWAAILDVDGKPSAFSFDINAGAHKYAIANSYDPAYAKHSPGKLLYYRNLVRAISDGIARVDWGAGDSGYKRTIGAEQGPAIRDWLLVRPGMAGTIAKMLGFAWRRSGN